MQDIAEWQAADYYKVDEQQCDSAEEVMHRYKATADLLRQLCQDTAISTSAPDTGLFA